MRGEFLEVLFWWFLPNYLSKLDEISYVKFSGTVLDLIVVGTPWKTFPGMRGKSFVFYFGFW